jgi:hypothetical protein
MTTKVTMNLTEQDVQNVDYLYEALRSRSKAQAISVALSLTRFVVEAMEVPGTQILLRQADGTVERIIMPELQNLVSKAAGRQPRAERAALVE